MLFLSDEPARIAAFLKARCHAYAATSPEDPSATSTTPPYNFVDFVSEMTMTDFTDDYQIRATLESQAQLLGTAFNYLMMEGDWKNLKSILRTQKVMRDTIELMNHYPPLTHLAIPSHVYDKHMEKRDASVD